ncbi:histidine phosphatase family protein [Sphingomonas sp. RRHST34]|jgi:phosphohistidine phosphatase|uniref:Histidine phosphatase family protein n=1 Tax=Sphingomonas citri TaxID=2862499 RepID=A0ABS7BNV1_9SPHN|nr:histidine phosphatase family protein [Sphingomonas citri]MBW6531299.1 histidine phosphatase family protein [Sphingomonas citri]
MKTLTLLRHAKSGWDDAVPRDLDRPLNPKGRRAAQAMGREIKAMELDFDRVIASPAVRVRETIEELERGLGRALAPEWDRRLYLASTATLLDVMHEQDDSAETLLLVGHNPGLAELVLALVPEAPGGLRDAVEEKYPTATLAEMTFAVDGWGAVARGGATLTRFVRPRDIDATLGPDGE